MKIDPIDFVLKQDFDLKKNFYLISGNEPTLMQKTFGKLTHSFKDYDLVNVNDINNIYSLLNEVGLFGQKKLYVCKNSKNLNEVNINNLKSDDCFIIFLLENSPKIKKFKSLLIKRDDSFVFDCYELDRHTKTRVINNFVKEKNIKIDQAAYWLLVEKTDDRYTFFENDLQKINFLNEGSLDIKQINKIFSINTNGKDKIFFNLFKKNNQLVRMYNEKINSYSDLNDFYYHCRFFCLLIINNQKKINYLEQIPRYLFKEKKFLEEIYDKFNQEKKIRLLNLMNKTENILRKNNNLSIMVGLRFLLSFKKIVIS